LRAARSLVSLEESKVVHRDIAARNFLGKRTNKHE